MNTDLKLSLVFFALALILACALGFAPNSFAWWLMAMLSSLSTLLCVMLTIDGISQL